MPDKDSPAVGSDEVIIRFACAREGRNVFGSGEVGYNEFEEF